jgi:hypothetical protein
MKLKLRDIEAKIAKKDWDGTLTEEEEDYLTKKTELYCTEHPDVTHRFGRWKKILAWISGYQYVDYHKKTKELLPVKLKRERKIVFNRLKPYMRTVLSKLTGVPSYMEVIPKTDENSDIDAAEIGDMAVDSLADKIGYDQIRKHFFCWLIALNRACVRVYWNKQDNGLVGYNTEPEKDQETGVELPPTNEPIYEEGDVTMEVVSPFNIRHDPLSSDPKKWRWFIYLDKADAEALEDEYDLEDGILKDKDETQEIEPTFVSQDGDIDFSPFGISEDEKVTGRTVTYKEFWTPKMYAIMAGGKVLEKGINPYGVIPFFVHEERLIPIDNYSKSLIFNDSIIKDLIPVQREYNRWMSLISLALERASKIKVMTPYDSLINRKQVSSEDGGITIVDYNPKMGVPPHQLKLDPLPAFAMQYKQELEREMESGGNVHEASFGRLPERASHASGTLVNLLVEQDDVVLDPLVRDVDRVFSQAWSLILKIVQDNYIRKRLLKIVGEDNIGGVLAFEGADLKGNTDVMVTPQIGLPKSRPLRIEYIMKMREAGLITDDKTALELMEFGQAKRIFKDQLLHERKALRENMMISKTPNITPEIVQSFLYEFDDDAAHMKVHLRDRLSAKYEFYSPEQKQALDLMIQLHNQRIQQAMMAQLQAQQQVNPSPAPTGQELTPEEAAQTPPPEMMG